jgi:hypothetical protein
MPLAPMQAPTQASSDRENEEDVFASLDTQLKSILDAAENI